MLATQEARIKVINACLKDMQYHPDYQLLSPLIEKVKIKAINMPSTVCENEIRHYLKFEVKQIFTKYSQFMILLDFIKERFQMVYGSNLIDLLKTDYLLPEQKSQIQLLNRLPKDYPYSPSQAYLKMSSLLQFINKEILNSKKTLYSQKQTLNITNPSTWEALDILNLKPGFHLDHEIKKATVRLLTTHCQEKNQVDYLSDFYSKVAHAQNNILNARDAVYSPYLQYFLSKDVTTYSWRQITEAIADLLFDSIQNSNFSTNSLIAKIADIILSQRHLKEYANRIVFSSENTNEMANFISCDKEIIFYKKIWLKLFMSSLKKIKPGLAPYYASSQLVKIIGHEIEHAHQTKLINQKNITTNTQLIQYCELARNKHQNNLYIIISNMKYEKFWQYCYTERTANFVGDFLALDVIRQLNKYIAVSDIEALIANDILAQALMPYKITSNPTAYYLKQFGLTLPDSIYEGLTPEEKMFYGLNLSKEELHYFQKNPDETLNSIQTLSKTIQK